MDKKAKKLEEGGILGLYDKDGLDVSRLMFYGLFALQHRGQTGCGMVTNDNFQLTVVKGKGTVAEVIEPKLNSLKGNLALGHVRYGSHRDMAESMQPLNSIYLKGSLTVSLAGTISNSAQLKAQLEDEGGIFQVGNDAEILAHLIARERIKTGSVEQAVLGVMGIIEGAFAALVMSPSKFVAFRDKHGFRPLCMGMIGNSPVFASEDVAFVAMGAKMLRDLEPGELILVDKSGVTEFKNYCNSAPKTCIYEYIYFARPDSVIDGKSVYEARINAGRELFKTCPAPADIVIGVPSAGLHYALGYARESGLPFGDGLIRNYYMGRTTEREAAAYEETMNVKLNVMRAAVEGLRVALVDDSMIRGVTAKRIIARLKESGAKEVHLRIGCPRFCSPCPFSPSLSGILYNMSNEEIRAFVGADSLGFLPKEKLDNIGLSPECCKGCFSR